MPLQAVFVHGKRDADGNLEVLPFSILIFSVIFGWILVSVFLRVLENFWFETLGMNSRSTVHAFIIALSMFLFFILFVWMIDEFQIIPATEAADSLSEATGGIESAKASTTPGQSSGNTRSVVASQLSNVRRGHPIVITPTSYY